MIRDRKRRPRGGPNPSRLRSGNSSSRFWVKQILWDRANPDGGHPTMEEISSRRARIFSTPSEFRYVRIRLKEAKP